jgi:hypothetical protein
MPPKSSMEQFTGSIAEGKRNLAVGIRPVATALTSLKVGF